MSDDNKQDETPFIDPNSGAAPQPGGFVSAGGEVGGGVGGRNAVEDHMVETQAVNPDAQEEEGGNPDAGAGASEEPEDETPEEEDDSEEEEGEYDELLSGTVGEVKEYLDENPDEVDAVKAAEAEGKNRQGIADY